MTDIFFLLTYLPVELITTLFLWLREQTHLPLLYQATVTSFTKLNEEGQGRASS